MIPLRIARLLIAALFCVPLMALSQTTEGSASLPESSSSTPSPSAKQKPGAATQPVYGSQLMTPEERAAYRDKMRAAKTSQAREQLRREHHAEMQARAKDRGVTLPDEPPERGGRRMGMGHGNGPGCRAGSAGCDRGATPGASSK